MAPSRWWMRGLRWRPASNLALMGIAVAWSSWLIVASPGRAGLEGSKHDFTGREWSGGSACQACHVPHRADKPKTPKWGGPSTIRSDPPADRGRPGEVSRICLGCHDGTAARNIFGDETAGRQMPARARIGKSGHLRNDHPIGVSYPIGDRKYQPLSRVEQSGRVRLFESAKKVECSSCHDPHNSYDQPYLLVMPNDESQLCTACHRL